ncbi:MAG: type II secretion system protein GspG [Acidobacteriota bacterium]|nr:MAG: type II secretion system protein GspG [Acidobacteriota bacterium]
MYCPHCGKQLLSPRDACPSCGSTQHTVRIEGDPMKRPVLVTLIIVVDVLAGLLFSVLGLASLLFGPGDPFLLVFGGLMLALGGWHLATAMGLWGLEPWARNAQILLSIAGLLGFPIGTLISSLIVLFMFKPATRVLFSGKSAEQLTIDELRLLADRGGNTATIAVIVVVLAMLPMCGVISAIAIPNLLNAIDRGKQKRSIADIRSMAAAVEEYSIDHDEYPEAQTIEDLESALVPAYMQTTPKLDGWGRPFVVSCKPIGCEFRSLGKDGIADSSPPRGPTSSFDEDIVFSNGQFVQWPEGRQREKTDPAG